MDKRAEYLHTLGLGPDATWEEVTQTYKDLMRVWHPDRFPSDERLRKKAEQESQRINHAMSELKKLGKEPPKRRKAASSQNQRDTAVHSQTSTQAHSGYANHFSNARPAEDLSRASFSYVIAPLRIRQKPSTSIMRTIFAAIVFYAAWTSMHERQQLSFQAAFSVSLIFAATDLAIRNILAIFLMNPIVAVDRAGILSLRTGRLGWLDIDRAWPVLHGRTSSLCITYSPQYIQKLTFMRRAFLYLRECLGSAHLTIPFNGLSGDPVQVLNAIKLQRAHDFINLQNPTPIATVSNYLAHMVCIARIAIVVLRSIFEPSLSTLDYAPYVAIFALAKGFDVTTRMLRTKVA
jgi:hypothetical protein